MDDQDRRVIIEKNDELYRVIGAIYYKGYELIRAHYIVESESLEKALGRFYEANPEWTNVYVKDNSK